MYENQADLRGAVTHIIIMKELESEALGEILLEKGKSRHVCLGCNALSLYLLVLNPKLKVNSNSASFTGHWIF